MEQVVPNAVLFDNALVMDEVSRLLSQGREVVILSKGQSMRPFIRGEVDSVRLQTPGTLHVGDIVLAHFESRYVMHRIYAIDGERITLMGDGNLQGTEQGMKSDVAGKVVEIIAPDGQKRKPTNGRIWRQLLPVRKYLLKIYRKWNRILGKQF